MIIQQLAHVCLNVKDLQESLRFYCDKLGLKKKFDFRDKAGNPFGCYLEVAPGQFIEIFQNNPAEQKNHTLTHLCFRVDSIQATIEHFDEMRLAFTPVKLGSDGSWQTWVTDPDGVRIEFHQYTDKSSQLTGADCHVTSR